MHRGEYDVRPLSESAGVTSSPPPMRPVRPRCRAIAPNVSLARPRRYGADDRVRPVGVRVRGRGDSGVHPAIARTQIRAVALFAIPGKCRRSSIAAASSPLSSNTWRMAAAVASSTLNMAQIWAGDRRRASRKPRRPTMPGIENTPRQGNPVGAVRPSRAHHRDGETGSASPRGQSRMWDRRRCGSTMCPRGHA